MFENFLDSIVDFLQKILTKKICTIILVLLFTSVAAVGVLFFLLEINHHNVYFTFRNKTAHPIILAIEDAYGRALRPRAVMPPFSEKEIKIVYEGFDFKVVDGPGKDASIGYYLSSGDSLFFKTRFLLEYDGEKINQIYAHKVDDWFW